MTEQTDNVSKLEIQERRYRDWQGLFTVLTELLRCVITRELSDLSISARVEARTKTIPSYVEKALRRKEDYRDPINEFPDLAGVRVIVPFKEDVSPVQAFVKTYFEVDDDDIEDTFKRHGTRGFGYAGIHFTITLNRDNLNLRRAINALSATEIATIVQDSGCSELQQHLPALNDIQSDQFKSNLRAAKKWLLTHLCEERLRGVADNWASKPKIRAEIQVRTRLQDVWAEFAHDRLYKMRVPGNWERHASRIAATLEEADEDIERVIRGLDEHCVQYHTSVASRDQEEELEIFASVLEYDEDNVVLTLKICRLARSLRKWPLVESTLARWVRKWEQSKEAKLLKRKFHSLFLRRSEHALGRPHPMPEVRRNPELSEILADYGWAKWQQGQKRGRYYLQWAIGLNPRNVEAYICLGRVFIDINDVEKALWWFERAFTFAPNEPRVLAGLLECRIVMDCDLDSVPMARGSLKAATELCGERARMGTFLPEAFFDRSLFAWLLGWTYEGIISFVKAVQCSQTASQLEDAIARIARMSVALSPKTDRIDSLSEDLQERYLVIRLFEKILRLVQYLRQHTSSQSPAEPLVMVLDQSDSSLSNKLGRFRQLLACSFSRYTGTLWHNGGEIQAKHISECCLAPKEMTGWGARQQQYSPSLADRSVDHLPKQDLNLIADRLQWWDDVLAQSISAENIKLLVVGGDKLVRFECMLALSLGVKVGVLPESGGAAAEMLRDDFWKDNRSLIRLPFDRETLRHFVCSIPPTVMLGQHREDMARQQHERYRKQGIEDRARREPNLQEWHDLPGVLKEANRRQIDHIETKLKAIGLQLRYVGHSDFEQETLTDKELLPLYEMEHGRWNADYLLDGWRLGPKSLEEKTSPYLIPWITLTDDIKKYDQIAVESIPDLLKEWGYQIIRDRGSREPSRAENP